MDTAWHHQQQHRSVQRAQRVLTLRVEQKLSFRAIGTELGISHTQASRLYRKAMEHAVAELKENAGFALVEELRGLDALWDINFRRATDRDRDISEQQAATDRCIKISIERRRLMGLDAPDKMELTGANGGPVVFAEVETLSGEALDKELEGFFNPGYMEGAAAGYAAGAADAAPKPKRRKAKTKPKAGAQRDAAPTDEVVAEVPERSAVVITPPSQGKARV